MSRKQGPSLIDRFTPAFYAKRLFTEYFTLLGVFDIQFPNELEIGKWTEF